MKIGEYLTRHKKWKIKGKDIVVDIGSGNVPFMRANILIEKYVEKSTERTLNAASVHLVHDRPLICADGEHLPFKDKSIDFIYCNQLIEHIVEPEKFIKEMERVARRGVIITLEEGFEKLFNAACHLWYISEKDGKMIFKQKKDGVLYPEIKKIIKRMVAAPGFYDFYEKNYDRFNVIYIWDGTINYEIERYGEFDFTKFNKGFMDDINQGPQPETGAQRPARRRSKIGRIFHIIFNLSRYSEKIKWAISLALGRVIRKLAYPKVDLNKILCCPKCKGDLTKIKNRNGEITCTSCNETYKLVNGIPYMDIIGTSV